MTESISLIAVAVLAAIHLFTGRLVFLSEIPRSRWLSAAGGISVAYVFLHLLPELSKGQEVVGEEVGEGLAFLDRHIYLVALTGLALFYGLERLARQHAPRRVESSNRRQDEAAGRGTAASPAGGTENAPVFWLHIGSFAIYNAIIGYLLLHRTGEDEDASTLAFFAVAMATHFLVNDVGLREHHRTAYHRVGRWILAGAVLLGWAVGVAYEVPDAALFLLLALIGGGVILNVLKEELPEERESRFTAFVLGAAIYAVLLLAT